MSRFLATMTVVSIVSILLVACGSKPATAKPTLRVLCGSSMAGPVEAITKAFGEEHGAEVLTDFGGCETLLPKILVGATADVFICHDPFEDKVREAGQWTGSAPVGALEPVLAVRPGNPKQIKSLDDLARADLQLGIGDPRYSTCGEMFVAMLKQKGLTEKIMPQVKAQLRSHSELANGLIAGPLDAIVIWNFAAALHKEKLKVVELQEHYAPVRVMVVGLSKCGNASLRDSFIEFCRTERVRTIFCERGYVSGAAK